MSDISVNIRGTANSLERTLLDASNGLKQLAGQIKGVDGAAKTASMDFQKLGLSLQALRGTGLALTGAFAGITAAFVGVTKRGVDMNVTLNQSRMALTQITGSSQKATQFVNALQVEAQKSILTFKQLLPLAQGLAASYGPQGLGKVIPTIRAFGDAAAALGVSSDAQERALLGFRQLLARATPSQQDVNQVLLNLPGLNIANVLKAKFGTADTETLSRAHHTGAEVADAIVQGMQKQFGGAQARLANTLPGILSNFSDAFDAFTSKLTADFTPRVTAALGSVLQAVQGLSKDKGSIEALKSPFNGLANAIEGVGSHIRNSIRWFQQLSPEAKTATAHLLSMGTALTGISGAGLLAASALGSVIRNVGQIAPLVKPLLSLLGSGVGAAATGSLIGALSTIGLMGAAAFTGWQIGRAIHDLTPLGKALDDILNKMMGIQSFSTGEVSGARSNAAHLARQLGIATIPGQAAGLLQQNPGAATKVQQMATRMGFSGGLTSLSPAQLDRIAKAIEAERRTVPARVSTVSGPSSSSGSGLQIADQLKGEPAFIQKMLVDAAHNVKEGLLQCGGVISKALQASGINATVTNLRNRARTDHDLQAKPSGFDAQGRPLYDPGTLFYFPPGGGSKQQHFAASLGGQKIIEYTTSGGGGYHYRTDRTLSQIAGSHGGKYEAFNADDLTNTYAEEAKSRQTAQEKVVENSMALGDRLNAMWQKVSNLLSHIPKDNAAFDKAAGAKMSAGINQDLTAYLNGLDHAKETDIRNAESIASSYGRVYDLRTEKEKELDRLKEENAKKDEERVKHEAELAERFTRANMEGFAESLSRAQDFIARITGPLVMESDGKGGNKVTSSINNQRLQDARNRMKDFYLAVRRDADQNFKGMGQSFFENLLSGGKRAKDAFKNLFSDLKAIVARSLSNILVENVSNVIRGGLGGIFGGGKDKAKQDGQTASIVKDGQQKLSDAFNSAQMSIKVGGLRMNLGLTALASILSSFGVGGGHKKKGGILGFLGGVLDIVGIATGQPWLAAAGGALSGVAQGGGLEGGLEGGLGGYIGAGGFSAAGKAAGSVSGAANGASSGASAGVSLSSLNFSRPPSVRGMGLGFSTAPSVSRLRSSAAMAGGGDIHVHATTHIGTVNNKADLMNSYEDLGYVVKRSLRGKV